MSVLDATIERMRRVFDEFEHVVVSVSGGKDSHVLWHLAVAEAQRRSRTVDLFFLDQEAEYQGTVDIIDSMMGHPIVAPKWFQVPLRMTNATSHERIFLNAWGPGEEWMREKSPLAIHEAPGAPDRFYDFFPWYEAQSRDTAFLVGIRSRESLNRWRAVTKNPGFKGIGWSTEAAGDGNFRFYPLFDWAVGDVWKYIVDHDIRYNKIYDRMFMLRGANERTMRVSFLVHEQSFRALTTLQELEPETHERLIRRLNGAHFGSIYAEELIMNARKLPAAFTTWRSYRDHLVTTTPLPERQLKRIAKRFASQGDDEATCREHCRQLLINDWENNVPVRRTSSEKLRERWWDRL